MPHRLNVFSLCLYIIGFLRVILSLFIDLVLFLKYTLNCWHAMSVIDIVLSFHCLNHLNFNSLVSYTGLFKIIVGVLTTCHTQYT